MNKNIYGYEVGASNGEAYEEYDEESKVFSSYEKAEIFFNEIKDFWCKFEYGGVSITELYWDENGESQHGDVIISTDD